MIGNIIEVKNLKVYFPAKKKLMAEKNNYIKAVDNISFEIKQGETLGIVGESGCGKSTTGRAILRLEKPKEGEILFKGENILNFNKRKLKNIRKKIQIVFQDPFASLNPRITVGDAIKEVLYIHGIGNKETRERRTMELFEMVGLNKKQMDRYPHEFSGGQRQRAVIARALAVNPEFIICDEPVSALDVSIQAQIINLLEELQQRFKLTYLFIAHDLSVVRHISNRIAVMYLGKIVEVAESDELFRNPKHPYTKALLSAIPICDPEIKREKILIQGDMPSPINPPSGCRFHTRCPNVSAICSQVEPVPINVGGDHVVACHLITK